MHRDPSTQSVSAILGFAPVSPTIGQRFVLSVRSWVDRVHRQFASVLHNLGYLYMNTGRYEEAEVQFLQSLAIAEGSGLGLDDIVVRSLHALGKIHMKRNEDAQADEALSRALGIARG